MKFFLDANMLFSASNSQSATCRLIRYLIKNYEVVTSDYAQQEAYPNVSAKRFDWLAGYENIISHIHIIRSIDKPVPVNIASKDRPVLATAIEGQCNYLLTGDKRDFGHLFGQTISGVIIVAPLMTADLLESLNMK